MHHRNPLKEKSEAMSYVHSLRDAVKRRFAHQYLQWIRAGRMGAPPNRGGLGATLAKAVMANLDDLA
jgi:hypothetical protein